MKRISFFWWSYTDDICASSKRRLLRNTTLEFVRLDDLILCIKHLGCVLSSPHCPLMLVFFKLSLSKLLVLENKVVVITMHVYILDYVFVDEFLKTAASICSRDCHFKWVESFGWSCIIRGNKNYTWTGRWVPYAFYVATRRCGRNTGLKVALDSVAI